MIDYIKQAEDFLAKTNTTFEKVLLTENANFDGDDLCWKRCKYIATFSRNGKKQDFEFTGRVWNCPASAPRKPICGYWEARQTEKKCEKEMLEARNQ